MHRYASMHTLPIHVKPVFPEPKGQNLVSKGTYFVVVFKNEN